MKAGIVIVLASVVILMFIAFGLRRSLDRVANLAAAQSAVETAQGWVGDVNISNQEVFCEKDGTFYLHVSAQEDLNRVSVWAMRPNHPSYDVLETAAEKAASGVHVVYSKFEISDPDGLPSGEPESYIRADSWTIGQPK